MNLHKAVDRMPRTVIVLGAAMLCMVLVALLVGTAGAQDSAARTGSQKDSPGTAEDATPSLAVASSGLATQDLAGGLTPSDLANKLVGSGVTVSNATYTGASTAGGTFNGGTGILDFEDGVILSSGNVSNVVGPNQFDDVTTSHGRPGDADLDALVNGGTRDAAVLEFDFVPDADKVFFSYVFASDEYNEYVNSGFDDVFAFFINGQNCATVDGDRVSINTINNGNPFGSGGPHSDLYINNDLSDSGGSINTEMDGLTTTLTCEATVKPNQTNHIKLAIADRGDTAFDSNVFLKSSSFSTTPPGNKPPSVDAGGPYEVNEGDTVDVSATGTDPEGGPLTYAWDLDEDGSFDDASTQSTSFPTDDGPSDSRTVAVQVTDDEEATATATTEVTVDNVEPTIQSIATSVSQTLTGKSVSFNASTTDTSTADTTAGFTYAWLVDGVANPFTGNPLDQSFSDCGDHSVSATATDKDGGVSASVTSDVVSVHEAHFRPPLDEGVYNTVQKGRVVPVKISIGCDGQNLTNLSPAIQLLKGDKSDGTETSSDAIETFSSSAADTTGIMRAVDDGYIYNLQVPGNAVAGDLYTIRVRPFGDSNTGASMYVVLKIRK